MSPCADHEWNTWLRSSRRTCSSVAPVTASSTPGRTVVSVMGASQRVRGKPRSMLEVAGSGQRCVTTLPRV